MHYLSLLITVFINPFPASLVLVHAHYFHLNFAVLGVTLLRDVPRQFLFVGCVQKILAKHFVAL